SAQSGRPMDIDPAGAAAEMQNLLAQERGTKMQYQVAATLCALTLQFRGHKLDDPRSLNDPHYSWGREYTRLAIARGCSQSDLENCPVLGAWAKSFKEP